MNKFLFALALFFSFSFVSQAQLIVDGDPIPDDVEYISILGFRGSVGKSTQVQLDYGQWEGRPVRQEYKDLDGRPHFFQNTMDAVNFFAKHGWELVTGQSYWRERPIRVDHYLVRRKGSQDSSTSVGASTRETVDNLDADD